MPRQYSSFADVAVQEKRLKELEAEAALKGGVMSKKGQKEHDRRKKIVEEIKAIEKLVATKGALQDFDRQIIEDANNTGKLGKYIDKLVKSCKPLADALGVTIKATAGAAKASKSYREEIEKTPSVQEALKQKIAESRKEFERFAKSSGLATGKLTLLAAATIYLGKKGAELANNFRGSRMELARYNVELDLLQRRTKVIGGGEIYSSLRKELNLTREQSKGLFDALNTGLKSGVVSTSEFIQVAKGLKEAFGGDQTQRLKEYVELIKEMPDLRQDLTISASFDDKSAALFALAKSGKLDLVAELEAGGIFSGKIDTSKEAELLNTNQKVEAGVQRIGDWLQQELFPGFAPYLIGISTGVGLVAVGVSATATGVSTLVSIAAASNTKNLVLQKGLIKSLTSTKFGLETVKKLLAQKGVGGTAATAGRAILAIPAVAAAVGAAGAVAVASSFILKRNAKLWRAESNRAGDEGDFMAQAAAKKMEMDRELSAAVFRAFIGGIEDYKKATQEYAKMVPKLKQLEALTPESRKKVLDLDKKMAKSRKLEIAQTKKMIDSAKKMEIEFNRIESIVKNLKLQFLDLKIALAKSKIELKSRTGGSSMVDIDAAWKEQRGRFSKVTKDLIKGISNIDISMGSEALGATLLNYEEQFVNSLKALIVGLEDALNTLRNTPELIQKRIVGELATKKASLQAFGGTSTAGFAARSNRSLSSAQEGIKTLMEEQDMLNENTQKSVDKIAEARSTIKEDQGKADEALKRVFGGVVPKQLQNATPEAIALEKERQKRVVESLGETAGMSIAVEMDRFKRIVQELSDTGITDSRREELSKEGEVVKKSLREKIAKTAPTFSARERDAFINLEAGGKESQEMMESLGALRGILEASEQMAQDASKQLEIEDRRLSELTAAEQLTKNIVEKQNIITLEEKNQLDNIQEREKIASSLANKMGQLENDRNANLGAFRRDLENTRSLSSVAAMNNTSMENFVAERKKELDLIGAESIYDDKLLDIYKNVTKTQTEKAAELYKQSEAVKKQAEGEKDKDKKLALEQKSKDLEDAAGAASLMAEQALEKEVATRSRINKNMAKVIAQLDLYENLLGEFEKSAKGMRLRAEGLTAETEFERGQYFGNQDANLQKATEDAIKVVKEEAAVKRKAEQKAYDQAIEAAKKEADIKKQTEMLLTAESVRRRNLSKIETDEKQKVAEFAAREAGKALERYDLELSLTDATMDFVSNMGGSFSEILKLQQQGLFYEQEKLKVLQEQLERSETDGQKRREIEVAIEMQKLKIQQKALGVQKDIYEKLLGKIFGQLAGSVGARRRRDQNAAMMGVENTRIMGRAGLFLQNDGTVKPMGERALDRQLGATFGGGGPLGPLDQAAKRTPVEAALEKGMTRQIDIAQEQLNVLRVIAGEKPNQSGVTGGIGGAKTGGGGVASGITGTPRISGEGIGGNRLGDRSQIGIGGKNMAGGGFSNGFKSKTFANIGTSKFQRGGGRGFGAYGLVPGLHAKGRRVQHKDTNLHQGAVVEQVYGNSNGRNRFGNTSNQPHRTMWDENGQTELLTEEKKRRAQQYRFFQDTPGGPRASLGPSPVKTEETANVPIETAQIQPPSIDVSGNVSVELTLDNELLVAKVTEAAVRALGTQEGRQQLQSIGVVIANAV